MANLTGKQIEDLARSIVAGEAGGIRFGELVDRILQKAPDQKNSIRGAVWNLHEKFPSEISKPSRGLFKPAGKPANEAVSFGNSGHRCTAR
jgi:hypothetical protein